MAVTLNQNSITIGNAVLSTAGNGDGFFVRAHIAFNGSTLTIKNSGNISALTDLGVGLWRVSFDTDMASDNNFVILTGINQPTTYTTHLFPLRSDFEEVSITFPGHFFQASSIVLEGRINLGSQGESGLPVPYDLTDVNIVIISKFSASI